MTEECGQSSVTDTDKCPVPKSDTDTHKSDTQ